MASTSISVPMSTGRLPRACSARARQRRQMVLTRTGQGSRLNAVSSAWNAIVSRARSGFARGVHGRHGRNARPGEGSLASRKRALRHQWSAGGAWRRRPRAACRASSSRSNHRHVPPQNQGAKAEGFAVLHLRFRPTARRRAGIAEVDRAPRPRPELHESPGTSPRPCRRRGPWR